VTDPIAVLDAALVEAEAAVAPRLLELCRMRIRMLLGVADRADLERDPQLAALADYPSSPLFDETERLALEFTEQYVMDVAGTPDALVAALVERLGPADAYGLVMALYAIDQSERLRISVRVHPEATR
jgi:alkylhydroperoxidase family enzyme